LIYKTFDFDKEEILFWFGIINRQRGKFGELLDCFDRMPPNPLCPLAHADIWLHIGHVFERQKNVRHLPFSPFSSISIGEMAFKSR